MEKIKVILNGRPDNGGDNIPRAGMAYLIPQLLGLAGGIAQSIIWPEQGNIAPAVTVFVPMVLGLLELGRQFRLTDKKNEEMDRRHDDNIRWLRHLTIMDAIRRK